MKNNNRFISSKLIKRIFILIITVVILFFIIEISLRIYWPGLNDMWKLMQYDPDIMRRTKANLDNITLHSLTREFTIKVNTDSRGFRLIPGNDKNNLQRKNLLIIGDSMTFGYGVEDREAFPAVIHRSQEEYKIINGGFQGCSPDCYYIYLKQNLNKINANHFLISIFLFNDSKDINFHKVILKNGEPDRIILPSDKIPVFIKSTALFQMMRLFILRRKKVNKTHPAKKRDISQDNNKIKMDIYYYTEKIINYIHLNKKKAAFIFIPYRKSIRRTHPLNLIKNKLKIIMKKHSVNYLDMAIEFEKFSEKELSRMYYPKDGHLTKDGHQNMGKIITEKLQGLFAN